MYEYSSFAYVNDVERMFQIMKPVSRKTEKCEAKQLRWWLFEAAKPTTGIYPTFNQTLCKPAMN